MNATASVADLPTLAIAGSILVVKMYARHSQSRASRHDLVSIVI
jgi:hypothetical protein